MGSGTMLHTEYKLFWKNFVFWSRSFIIVREVWLQLIFEEKNWYSKKYIKKYTTGQRLNLILSEKVRLKRPYRSHYFTMSRSEQVNLWICSVLLWLDIFRIWSQTAYSSLLTTYKVFLKIKLRLNFKMSQTQYEFESYRISSVDNMHSSFILLCEKMIK